MSGQYGVVFLFFVICYIINTKLSLRFFPSIYLTRSSVLYGC